MPRQANTKTASGFIAYANADGSGFHGGSCGEPSLSLGNCSAAVDLGHALSHQEWTFQCHVFDLLRYDVLKLAGEQTQMAVIYQVSCYSHV